MKQILLLLLTIYQKIISPLLHQLLGQKNLCRYEMSCSEFAKQAIKKDGVIKGSKNALVRFLNCSPVGVNYV